MADYGVSRSALLLDFDPAALRALNDDLRRLDKALANDLRKNLRVGANILRDGLREAARDTLGGLTTKGALNEGSAAAFGINNSINRDRVAVKWKARTGPRGFTQRNMTNSGRIRHPVHGNRDVWVTTDLNSGRFGNTRGWWDRAEEKHLEESGEKIIEALDVALRTLGAFSA